METSTSVANAIESFAFDTYAEVGSGRTVTALAVPFNAAPHDGRKVAFLPGSFKNTIQGRRQSAIPFYGLHPSMFSEQLPVGHSIHLEETGDGLLSRFVLSDTERGNEVLTLIKDGVLHSVSVGVVPLRTRKVDGRTEFQEVKLHHVAAVPDPAFETASVLDVHSSKIAIPQGLSLDIARARLASLRK